MAWHLAGIDDPATIREIKARCSRRAVAPGFVFLSVILCAGGSGVSVVVVNLSFGLRGVYAWIGCMVCIAINVALLAFRYEHRASRYLPEVLRAMGRCTKCGYELGKCAAERCPECGEVRHAEP